MSKAFRLFIAGLILLPLAMLAEAPSSEKPASPSCNPELIRLTDPELAKKLESLTVASSGPLTVEHRTSGETTTKVSRKEFLTYDENGNALLIAAKCTLSCTGSSCSQDGCEPDGFTGCTSWSCGLTCIGTCTQSSEVLEVRK
ncbi:MAG TPA: hypothetical protein VGG03_06795 [Thermoanaerobaculia bacterium]